MTEPRKPTEKLAKPSKRAVLAAWLAAHAALEIGEIEYAELRQILSPISESYLRKLLRDSAAPLAPMIAGVRQATLDELEESLLLLLDEYELGDRSRQAAVRQIVITAKDHARYATKIPQSASNKQEMILWMLTWLENPPVFRHWVALRRSLSTPQDLY